MIGRQRSPEQTMNKNGIQSNGLGYASIEVRPRVLNLNSTVKLGDKERFDKEQIGVKEPFPVTKYQFTS